jgi:hypothetical protein
VWVRRAAIRPVPRYAQLPLRVLASVEEDLSGDEEGTSDKLDDAFSRFEVTQPVLAERISEVLGRPLDETALALGYFLTLAVWLAFDRTFGADLERVDETALAAVDEAFSLDEELRLADPAEAVDSDDVVAMEQPELLAFVHEHLEAALESNADSVNVDDVHTVYRVVLIEVLALSYAVAPPKNWVEPAEFSA